MVSGRWIPCCQCQQPIWMAAGQEEIARRTSQNWFCLWGHSQHFPQGPTEAETLRLERDRLKQEGARLEEAAQRARDQRDAAERRASAARGQVTRLKNRAANGVCPCCNRSFSDLRRHMATKHAGFLVEAVQAEAGTTIQ